MSAVEVEVVDRYPSGRCGQISILGVDTAYTDVRTTLTLDELEDLHEQIGGAIAELQGQIDERDPDEYRDNRIEEAW